MTAARPLAAAVDEPLVAAAGVGKTFPAPEGEVTALVGFDLSVGAREFVSLIGPSGCGKSTALSIIAGLLPLTEGSIRLGGADPARARADHRIGMVFQQPVLLPWLTIEKNCGLLLKIAGEDGEVARARVADLLRIVGLSSFAKAYPHQLSGGMRQRASIARALALDPLLLLMDEPFSALDEFTRHQMNVELLAILEARPKAVVFVTHNIAEAVFLSDRVVAMTPRPGRIALDLAIDLPRPRRTDVRYTPAFADHVVRLQRLLEEAASLGATP